MRIEHGETLVFSAIPMPTLSKSFRSHSESDPKIHRLQRNYFALGELSDVHKCQLLGSRSSHNVVAVKVLRGISLESKDQQSFEDELVGLVRLWKSFNHPHVIKCYGFSIDFGHMPGIVLEYCERGSILDYLRNFKDARPLSLLLQVANAVNYLHSRKCVHGDIRASNILINFDGTPVLMDAGLYTVISCASHLTTAGICKSCRWMAPEVLDPPEEYYGETPNLTYTTQSDVYSLGMTILEVLTRKPPFSNRRYDTVVILEVIRRGQPTRPDSLLVSNDIWKLMQSCWAPCPKDRPSALKVERWLSVIFQMETSSGTTANS